MSEAAGPPQALPASVFNDRWLVLEHEGGDRPELKQIAVVARRLRDSLLSIWADPPPEWLSGHAPDGAPSQNPHLAIVPFSEPPSAEAAGRLVGLGLATPRGLGSGPIRELSSALAGLCGAQTSLQLRLGRNGVWSLRPVSVPSSASLKPSRYAGLRWPGTRGASAEIWTTVTPIALDRHPGGPRSARASEINTSLAKACARIGLPEAAEVSVRSFASPGDWARPKNLADRRLIHAQLRFLEPVQGPVLLGAGRFFGLGLCKPVAA